MDKNYELKNYRLLKSELLKRYKGKFNFDFLLGRIDGSDNLGNGFTITISNTDTVLTVTPTTDKTIAEDITKIIKSVMNARPICQYELKYFGITMPTIEWDILAPEERIMNLVQENNTFIDSPPIYNLHLFGGRKIREYQKIKEFDINKVVGENEFMLYYEISTLSKSLCDTKNPAPEQLNYLNYLIRRTTIYGVELEKDLEKSTSFKAWLSFWDDFKNSLSLHYLEQLIRTIDEGKDVSYILPRNNWKDKLDLGLKE